MTSPPAAGSSSPLPCRHRWRQSPAVAFAGARLFLLLFLVLGLSFSSFAASSSEEEKTDDGKPTKTSCGLYLAPSSTALSSDDPTLGMYAGIDVPAKTPLGPPEMALQLIDWHVHAEDYVLPVPGADDEEEEDEDNEENPAGTALALIEGYLWTSDVTGSKYEASKDDPFAERSSVTTLIPGYGVLGNFFPGISNAEFASSSVLLRQAEGGVGLKETVGPGRGAFTSYHNVTLVARKDVPAGMELFLDMGSGWEPSNDDDDEDEETEKFTELDYDRADETMTKLQGFFDKYSDELSPEAKEEVYKFFRLEVLGTVAGADHSKTARTLLPKDPNDIADILTNGGSAVHHNPTIKKDINWLEEHGSCLTNLYPKPSAIPHAGRGAFAARSFGTGDVISPMPVFPLPLGREMVDVYKLTKDDETGSKIREMEEAKKDDEDDEDDEGDDEADTVVKDPIGKQLLYNYALCHPQSSMLLVPYATGASFINHGSGDTNKANAKLVWSKSGMHHADMLDLTPDDFAVKDDDNNVKFEGLMLDVVATRDIAENEEILINYGSEWEQAWSSHVTSWDTKKDYDLTSTDLNERYRTQPYPTEVEHAKDKSYDNTKVATACFVLYDASRDEPTLRDGKHKVYPWVESDPNRAPHERDAIHGMHLHKCTVVDRADDEAEEGKEQTYTIRMSDPTNVVVNNSSNGDEKDDDEEEENVIYVKNVPHHAIRFVDLPYQGDQHRIEAFRQCVGLPDEMLPDSWRDLAE